MHEVVTDSLVVLKRNLLRFRRQPEMLVGIRAGLDNPLLQDMGIHHMDLLRFLAGRNAVEIYAREHRPVWSEFQGRPNLDAVITLEDGAQVSYSGSWAGRGRSTEWRLMRATSSGR